jgi:hypothetical protein
MKNLLQKLYAIALTCCIGTITLAQTPALNSLPSAVPTIFLDFDGQHINAVWNSYVPFYAEPSGLNAAQITEVFSRVSEDFRPFNINVTTDSTKYWAAPVNQRTSIVITPTNFFQPTGGGVAYVGSFIWGDEIPGFVFPNRLGVGSANWMKKIAEAATHEAGHTLGLSHQAKYDNTCTRTEIYNTGYGNGETSWAPIMGAAYNRNMSGWNDGPTPTSCTELQDNLSIILTRNTVSYREDDYANTANSAAAVLNENGFNVSGVITTSIDKDAFKIVNTQADKRIILQAKPYSVANNNDGSNLDIALDLMDNNGTILRTYNPADALHVNIDTVLAQGTYYFMLRGVGNTNTSDYGSLGSYTLTASRGVLPIRAITLKGNSVNGKHMLNWSIIADEPIAEQIVEVSSNGNNFKPLQQVVPTTNALTTDASTEKTQFYRLKVMSVIGETAYSNIVALRNSSTNKVFEINSISQNNFTVTAFKDGNYNLFDTNGKLMAAGKLQKGVQYISTTNYAKGIYFVQLISNENIQTERILK